MYVEEDVQNIQGRRVCVPDSVLQVVQALGHQLTRYDALRGRRRVDIKRAMPVCMILADNDTERAAHLLQGFIDALDEWTATEAVESDTEFTGQPVP